MELVDGASHFGNSLLVLGFLISGFGKCSIVSALQFSETRVGFVLSFDGLWRFIFKIEHFHSSFDVVGL